MKVKFNKFEKVAGVFVLFAMVGSLVGGAVIAVKRGWFDSKISYTTSFKDASGIHPGTLVQIAGLRAGSVDEVELKGDNEILVKFSVTSKFQSRIREDSTLNLVRPFIIGEKIIEVEVGDSNLPMLVEGTYIQSEKTLDLMDMMNGKTLGPALENFGGFIDNLKLVAEAFSETSRTKSLIKTFDQIEPLVANMNIMSREVIKLGRQMTKEKNLEVVLSNLAVTTQDLNSLIPIFVDLVPSMSEDITSLVGNMAVLTEEFTKILPMIGEIAPELPYAGRRAMEALDETVVVLKALQKSFFLSGAAEDVREEESQRDKQVGKKQRMPSNDENQNPVEEEEKEE